MAGYTEVPVYCSEQLFWQWSADTLFVPCRLRMVLIQASLLVWSDLMHGVIQYSVFVISRYIMWVSECSFSSADSRCCSDVLFFDSKLTNRPKCCSDSLQPYIVLHGLMRGVFRSVMSQRWSTRRCQVMWPGRWSSASWSDSQPRAFPAWASSEQKPLCQGSNPQ